MPFLLDTRVAFLKLSHGKVGGRDVDDRLSVTKGSSRSPPQTHHILLLRSNREDTLHSTAVGVALRSTCSDEGCRGSLVLLVWVVLCILPHEGDASDVAGHILPLFRDHLRVCPEDEDNHVVLWEHAMATLLRTSDYNVHQHKEPIEAWATAGTIYPKVY